MAKSTIGARIAQKRKEKGLSQEELAKKVDLSRSGVAQIETDVTKPTIEFLTKFVRIADTSYQFILEGAHEYAHLNTGAGGPNESNPEYIHISNIPNDPYVKKLLTDLDFKDQKVQLLQSNSELMTKTIKLLEEKIKTMEDQTKQKN